MNFGAESRAEMGRKMVTVGIIGAGRIGKVHVESICTKVADAKVKTLADPFINDATAAWAKEIQL